MKEIIVEVRNDGEIQIETRGFKGKDCITETEFLKKTSGKRNQPYPDPCILARK